MKLTQLIEELSKLIFNNSPHCHSRCFELRCHPYHAAACIHLIRSFTYFSLSLVTTYTRREGRVRTSRGLRSTQRDCLCSVSIRVMLWKSCPCEIQHYASLTTRLCLIYLFMPKVGHKNSHWWDMVKHGISMHCNFVLLILQLLRSLNIKETATKNKLIIGLKSIISN